MSNLDNLDIMDWCGTELDLGLLLDEEGGGDGGVVMMDVQQHFDFQFHEGTHSLTHLSDITRKYKVKRLKCESIIKGKSNKTHFNYLHTIRNLKLVKGSKSQRVKSINLYMKDYKHLK